MNIVKKAMAMMMVIEVEMGMGIGMVMELVTGMVMDLRYDRLEVLLI